MNVSVKVTLVEYAMQLSVCLSVLTWLPGCTCISSVEWQRYGIIHYLSCFYYKYCRAECTEIGMGVNFFKAARLEAPLFKLLGVTAFEPLPHISTCKPIDITDDLN